MKISPFDTILLQSHYQHETEVSFISFTDAMHLVYYR